MGSRRELWTSLAGFIILNRSSDFCTFVINDRQWPNKEPFCVAKNFQIKFLWSSAYCQMNVKDFLDKFFKIISLNQISMFFSFGLVFQLNPLSKNMSRNLLLRCSWKYYRMTLLYLLYKCLEKEKLVWNLSLKIS